MPIYEYQCELCDQIFEYMIFKSDDEKDIECPKCKEKKIKRVLSPTGFLGSSCASAPSGFS